MFTKQKFTNTLCLPNKIKSLQTSCLQDKSLQTRYVYETKQYKAESLQTRDVYKTK